MQILVDAEPMVFFLQSLLNVVVLLSHTFLSCLANTMRNIDVTNHIDYRIADGGKFWLSKPEG